MLKDITIGQYLPGESFIHKLDPRTKILISLFFIVCLFIVNKFIGYTVVVGFLFAPIRKGITICSNNVDSFSSNEAYDNNQASSTNYKENKKKGRSEK